MKKDEPKDVADDVADMTAAELDVMATEGDDVADDGETEGAWAKLVVVEAPSAPTVQRHALDEAPIGSKLVVALVDGKPKAILAPTGGDPTPLPFGDVAHKLPEGARILKTTAADHLRSLAHDPTERRHAQNALQGWSGDLYVSEQLSAQEWHHPLYRASGAESIADFVGHFHRGYSDPDAPVLSTDV